MGANKREAEKLRYSFYTHPMTVEEYHNEFEYNEYIKGYSVEPDDYEKLFKDDPKYRELNKIQKDAKKSRDAYKDIKRTLHEGL